MIEKVKYLVTCDNCEYRYGFARKHDIYKSDFITYRWRSVNQLSDELFFKKYAKEIGGHRILPPLEYHFCCPDCEKEYKEWDNNGCINDNHYFKVKKKELKNRKNEFVQS